MRFHKHFACNKSKLILPHSRHSDDYLRTITSILRGARWFGIIGKTNGIAVIWGIIIFASLAAITSVAMYRVMKVVTGYAVDTSGGRSATARLSGALFYANSSFSLVLLWRFSASWPTLAAYWAAAERRCRYLPTSETDIRKRLIFVTTLVTACGVLEHLLSIISAVGFQKSSLAELIQSYTLNSHGFLMHKHQYSISVGIFLFITSKFATILWNFQDLLIVLLSMGLSSRYERLNKQIHILTTTYDEDAVIKNKELHSLHWRKIREAYVRQSALVRLVDADLGNVILLSNFNNMYFICLQLFLGISEGIHKDRFSFAYYVLSLLWLCIRAAGVVYAAADINVHSRGALRYIHDYPSSHYSIEIERLNNQLSKEFIALSGRGFYYLDRQVLLTVTGTIATYELVLLQYDNYK